MQQHTIVYKTRALGPTMLAREQAEQLARVMADLSARRRFEIESELFKSATLPTTARLALRGL
ncbi:MAG TPA: hypothetical protein VI792_03300 [Candidatus Eisenbacteria bacterium]